MIIKGKSRSGPKQLARHLLRTDTNERVLVLDNTSMHGNLSRTFRDWQLLVGGTRGTKGLYHANIDPAEHYVMTKEQWLHSVSVLEKELGLEGQPRVIVMHQKEGREHIHVVWQRTDIDTMTLRTDSFNYLAHERASQQLEKEFGHEHVPGKHDKRDRSIQSDMPREAINFAEWQQSERTGIDPRERKNTITRLYEQSDSASALQAAIEEQGYLLAKGDRRDFVIVDTMSEVYSLSRQIRGATAKELRAFMSSIDRDELPTVDEAKELQKQAMKERAEGERRKGDTETAALELALKERYTQEREKLRAGQAAELKHLRRVLATERREKLEDQKTLQAAERRRLREQQHRERSGFVSAVKRRISPKRAAEQDAARLQKRKELADRQKQEREDLRARLNLEAQYELAELKERHAQKHREQTESLKDDLDRHLRDWETARRLLDEQKRAREKEEQRTRDGPDRPPKRTL
ncbi:MAG: hypothetical protein IPM20_06380 [Gammaproteobacteria bacterium]|nr:hypothetical protein [Gammaproteobacteria bacterium]